MIYSPSLPLSLPVNQPSHPSPATPPHREQAEAGVESAHVLLGMRGSLKVVLGKPAVDGALGRVCVAVNVGKAEVKAGHEVREEQQDYDVPGGRRRD